MPKIFSCSLFFNEFDILKLKIATLGDVVDYFVISESNFTHSGKPKPIYLLDSFSMPTDIKNGTKIIHQVIRDTPNKYTEFIEKDGTDQENYYYNFVMKRVLSGNWWNHNIESYGRDTFEKESLIRALFSEASDDDIILLSDLDEIVRPEVLESVLKEFNPLHVYHFQHDMFYYYLNLQKDEPWHGTLMCSFRKFREMSFCEMRTYKKGVFVPNGGWHFTYQNGAEAVKTKLESFGEQSLNLPHIKNNISYSIDNAIVLGRDLFGRPCRFTKRDINDGTFPQYLVEHQNDIFKDYILW